MVAPPDPLYCTIFVDSALPPAETRALVAHAASGHLDVTGVVSPELEVTIKGNGYADGPSPATGAEFLTYRYYAEVEPTPQASREVYVAAIGRLLQDLWVRGIPAVAACDFEDELPEHGGRDRVPASLDSDGHNSPVRRPVGALGERSR